MIKNWEFNWKDNYVPKSKCPYCDKEHDGASSPEGATPNPGDYCICIWCASMLKFGDNMELLPVSKYEMNTLNNEHSEFMAKMRLMQRAVRSMDRRPKHERERN